MDSLISGAIGNAEIARSPHRIGLELCSIALRLPSSVLEFLSREGPVMSSTALLWLSLIVSQATPAAPAEAGKPGRTAEDFDEDMIAGHPDLEPLPHPSAIDWSLD